MSIEDANYYGDRRVNDCEDIRGLLQDINEKAMTANVMIYAGKEPESHPVKLRYEVCPVCDGSGKHVNPSIDCGGISQQEFEDDPDFAESYRRGDYDVQCTRCDGKRVVLAIDESRTNQDTIAFLQAEIEEGREYDHQLAMEIRYGA